MNVIPWRIKNYLSEHFPLLYHLAANFGRPRNNPAHWDLRLAETWDEPSRKWPTKNALTASLTSPSDTILDVGCGNGDLLRHLKGLGYRHLHGLEISKYAIERLQEAGIKMHHGVLPMIPLADETFDVVIASQVLEHIVFRRRFLSEIRRVLKPGGRALIFVPDNCLGPIDEPEHVIKFTSSSLRTLAERFFTVRSLVSMRDSNHEIPLLFLQAEKPAR